MWNTGATYGAKLQNLQYACKNMKDVSFVARMLTFVYKNDLQSEAAAAGCGLPGQTLLLNGVASILIPYLHSRLRLHALARAWPDAPSSDMRRRAWTWVTATETLHNTLSLFNFISFLCNGRCVVVKLMVFLLTTDVDIAHSRIGCLIYVLFLPNRY